MPGPKIDVDECSACGICVDNCPNGVLDLNDDNAYVTNEDDCDSCGTCQEECPMEAIAVEEE